jgi:hypothetical protein
VQGEKKCFEPLLVSIRESRRKNASKQNKRKILGRTRLHGKWTHEWRKEKCIKESRSQPPTPYSNSSRFFSRISPRSLFILSIWRWPSPAKVAAKLRPHCCSCLLQANFSVIGLLAHSSRLPRARLLGRKDPRDPVWVNQGGSWGLCSVRLGGFRPWFLFLY